MIRQWVLYHGSLYGFSNLHVIDASTDLNVINFLKSAQDKLKINVVFSKANLNEVNNELNQVMLREKKYSDFMIKLDTDELLTVYNPVTKRGTTNKTVIQNYLNSLPFDGRKYKVDYTTSNFIEYNNMNATEKCAESMLTITNFSPFTSSGKTKKSFFPSDAFVSCDLGGHHGATRKEFNLNTTHPDWHTNMAVFHFHWQCFERVVANNKQAIMSHNYLLGNETQQEAIYKLGMYT